MRASFINAFRAYQYSHQVAIWNKGLCIEVSKSKSLFGDLQALTQILKQTSASQNFKIQLAFGYTLKWRLYLLRLSQSKRLLKNLYRLAIDAEILLSTLNDLKIWLNNW